MSKILPLFVLLTSCTSSGLYQALPAALERDAQVVGFQSIRAWGDKPSLDMQRSAREAVIQAENSEQGRPITEVNALALSAGGADGAFGAGLLCGWTENGTRPEFQVVSGVSTGALIAPFAFLGSKYDAALKEVYTTLSDNNIYQLNNPFSVLFTFVRPVLTPSLASNKPLAQMIRKVADHKMLQDIAREHLKGRRLFIATAQLNAQRLVIWDIGAIANSNNPDALKLFHKILLASSALPGIFPPQYFQVEAGGKVYKEMHVDGGVETQVMLFENALLPFARISHPRGDKNLTRRLYIIRNLKVSPEWQSVKPRLHYMLSRVLFTLTKNQGIGDLYRLYAFSLHDHIDYNLAYIPNNFHESAQTPFDGAYMKKLFILGYELGKKGYHWKKFPPHYQSRLKGGSI